MTERLAFSAEEAAAALGVHPATVRRMMARGQIPFVTLGVGPRAKRRIARSALERLLDPEREAVSS